MWAETILPTAKSSSSIRCLGQTHTRIFRVKEHIAREFMWADHQGITPRQR